MRYESSAGLVERSCALRHGNDMLPYFSFAYRRPLSALRANLKAKTIANNAISHVQRTVLKKLRVSRSFNTCETTKAGG